MVYVLKKVLSYLFLWKVWSNNQMPADDIYHICRHIFGEVITLHGQEKFHFIIPNLSFM